MFLEHFIVFYSFFFFFFSFLCPSLSSQHKGGGKRKDINLSISAKLELKKLESGVSVARVCEEYRVKKTNRK